MKGREDKEEKKVNKKWKEERRSIEDNWNKKKRREEKEKEKEKDKEKEKEKEKETKKKGEKKRKAEKENKRREEKKRKAHAQHINHAPHIAYRTPTHDFSGNYEQPAIPRKRGAVRWRRMFSRDFKNSHRRSSRRESGPKTYYRDSHTKCSEVSPKYQFK